MPRDANGNYVRSVGGVTGAAAWGDAFASQALITTVRHDEHDEDMAEAISASLARDGNNAAQANIPMAGFKFTGAGRAAAAAELVTLLQLDERLAFVPAAQVSETRTLTTLTIPLLSQYVDGQIVAWIIETAPQSGDARQVRINALSNQTLNLATGDAPGVDVLAVGTLIVALYTGVGVPDHRRGADDGCRPQRLCDHGCAGLGDCQFCDGLGACVGDCQFCDDGGAQLATRGLRHGFGAGDPGEPGRPERGGRSDRRPRIFFFDQ